MKVKKTKLNVDLKNKCHEPYCFRAQIQENDCISTSINIYVCAI